MSEPVRIIVDGRDLLPPEPMEQTLAALDKLPPGGEVVLLVHCQPRPLFNILQRNGYRWEESAHPDGHHQIVIRAA